MDQEDIGKRIARIRESKDMNQSDLARAIGVSPQAVQKWEAGGKPRFNRLKEIAETLGVTLRGLIAGTPYEQALSDQSFLSDGELPRNVKFLKPSKSSAPAPGKLPLISWVQAGEWAEAIDQFAPGDAEDWIFCPFNHSKDSFVLKVVGESMYDPGGQKSYAPGDYVAVDPQREAVNRSMVVVKLIDDNKATFKQLIIDPDGTKMLKALNPNWPKPFIEINGNARIVGVVIGKWVPE